MMSNLSPDTPITVANLLEFLRQGWGKLWDYLNTLTPEQLTQKTDAAGWTIKDHVMHMALWEVGIAALLERQSRTDAMGFDESVWDLPIDEVNAILQQRYKHLEWEDVKSRFTRIHERLLKVVTSLNDADLVRPYKAFDPKTDEDDRPVIEFIVGNTFEHYEEHLPWLKAIAES
ncbi:MAG: DinB family protein [Anaerolineae bacterium]